MNSRKRKRPRSPVRLPFGEASRLETETTLLVLLSAADLFMTYTLLWQGAHFYESNPIAQWFFQRWNIAGMTAYKFGMVGVIVVLSETIERHRPGWGRAIVLLGGLAALVAAVHGLRLLLQHG
ncbi:MAG: DUF5658 family protein [Isosphaeraceae bacterium]|nr:DUF5658 family protein [Isosphaeraceae bacterium]